MLPDTSSYCKIACYINNSYGKRLQSDRDLDDKIISSMEAKRYINNTLAEEVLAKRWSRKKLPFKKISSEELLDFPELTNNDLKILFTGTYQLKQSVSYLAELMGEDGDLKIEYCREAKNLIRLEVQSRHVNRNKYKCFIEYIPDSIGPSSISRYCCSCANGNRVVGCCAHVAAAIYYLSNARYLSKIIKPACILSKMFTQDSIEPTIHDDSDEED